MKRKSIQLIVLIGILALLLVGYFVLTSVTGDGEGTEDISETQTWSVCTVDQSTVSRIAYTHEGVEYVYNLKADATGWEWSEDPVLPLDNLYFAAMVTACTDLTSTVRLTDVTAEQLTEYGLGDDADTVHFTDAVNGAQTWRIGAYNSFNGMIYFSREGALSTVYMVASTLPDAFAYTAYDMVKVPDLPTDITSANLVRVTLTPAEGSGMSTMVYTYYVGGKSEEDDTDVWYVSRDGAEETRLDEDTGNSLSLALTTLAFSGVVGYTEAEKTAFGLDTPVSLTVDYKVTTSFEDSTTGAVTKVNTDSTFTLLLGGISENGQCYATVEDSPLSCTLMGTVFGQLLKDAAAR